jgi:hypothetical protein
MDYIEWSTTTETDLAAGARENLGAKGNRLFSLSNAQHDNIDKKPPPSSPSMFFLLATVIYHVAAVSDCHKLNTIDTINTTVIGLCQTCWNLVSTAYDCNSCFNDSSTTPNRFNFYCYSDPVAENIDLTLCNQQCQPTSPRPIAPSTPVPDYASRCRDCYTPVECLNPSFTGGYCGWCPDELSTKPGNAVTPGTCKILNTTCTGGNAPTNPGAPPPMTAPEITPQITAIAVAGHQPIIYVRNSPSKTTGCLFLLIIVWCLVEIVSLEAS